MTVGKTRKPNSVVAGHDWKSQLTLQTMVLPALIALTVRRIPPEVLASCRERAEGMWQDGRPKKWYFALPVVGAWLLPALLLWKAVS